MCHGNKPEFGLHLIDLPQHKAFEAHVVFNIAKNGLNVPTSLFAVSDTFLGRSLSLAFCLWRSRLWLRSTILLPFALWQRERVGHPEQFLTWYWCMVCRYPFFVFGW